ncbi:IS701 family transposase [Streptomyces sp. HUAS TT7]|uniref:IS701 family transposase n=1 Tax=Streptomyces sp. HUAS TT7 TaxID=3447507 RepID=UPI003F654DBA
MLLDPTVPASLRGCFTYPAFHPFAALVTGLIAQTGQSTVCGMLSGAGAEQVWSHDRAHAFFSRAVWSADLLGAALSHLVVRLLLDEDAPLVAAVDDTLFKRCGRRIFGAAWQHYGAARGKKPIGYGTCFVVLGLIVRLPFLKRPVCLPVLARLHRPKHGPSKVEQAVAMVRFLSTCHGRRRLHVAGDAHYHGPALRALPGRVTLTVRLPAPAVLYATAPPPTGKRGRPRLKGERLGTAEQLAAACRFTPATVTRYGRTEHVFLATRTCLWYGSLHTQTVRVILLRDQADDAGYSLALVTTDLATPAAELITRYAWRWSIEVTFAEARDLLGVGQARNRTRRAVERTVPFGLYCYTITVLWYTRYGHHPNDAAEHRARTPWYATKTTPAFSDMVAKLRRVMIAARFMPMTPAGPRIRKSGPSNGPGPQPARTWPDGRSERRKSRDACGQSLAGQKPAVRAALRPDRLLLDQPGRAVVRLLAHQMIRRGAHKNIQALEADIRAWVKDWNEDPKPFIWTKTAEEILDSLARFCRRISGAGH